MCRIVLSIGFMTSSHIPSDNPLYHDTLELLIALVQNACVNDFTPGSGQEVRNADTLTEFFADTLGINIQRFEPEPGRVSLVVTVPGTNPQEAEPLTFLAHTDVVPVDKQHWTKPPFEGMIENGKIYGRGTVDMLFITAAMAVVTREVARKGGNLGTLHFVAGRAGRQMARGAPPRRVLLGKLRRRNRWLPHPRARRIGFHHRLRG